MRATPGGALDLLEEDRRRQSAARRYNVVTVPTIRLLGVNAVGIAALLHHALIGPAVSNATLFTFLAVAEVYALATWAALPTLWDRGAGRVHVPFALLALDIAVCAGATYVTGAERSWLFFLIALRLADSSIGFARTLALAHLAPLLYLAMLWYAHTFDGRDIPSGLAAVNTFTLYGVSLYFALIGRTATALRHRVAAAARARLELIVELEEKSARLELSMLRAEQASRSKERFLSTVSHELRTPLTTILAQTQLVMDEADHEKDAAIIADLQEVVRSARELSGMVDNLLEVSGIETSAADLVVDVFDVADLVREVSAKAQPMMNAGGNAFHVTNDVLLGAMRSDRARLRQVLLILLGNAAKFTSQGSVTLAVRHARADEQAAIAFTVTDTGIGIGDEMRDALFTPFTQGDESSTRKYGGTGLGLVIAKRYADLISAELVCETTVGAGSSFTLVVPIGQVAGAHSTLESSQVQAGLPA